jgi:hypothetical protein
MKTRCRLALIVGLLTLMAAPAYSAVITQWAFENPPNPIAVNNSPAPSTGGGTASSIGMDVFPTPNIGVTTDDVLNGVAGDTGGNGNADLTQIWRVRAQAGAAGAANGWSSMAPIGTQGAVFAASTVGFASPINVSYDWYATNQGEANQQLRYTTNAGATWTNVPIALNASDGGLAALVNALSPNTVLGSYVHITGGGQGWFPGLTATIVDPLAANNPKFAIEMVNASTDGDNVNTLGTALNNSSGNWRFDNVAISGSAVPEPCSIVLAGIALTWLSVCVARRK